MSSNVVTYQNQRYINKLYLQFMDCLEQRSEVGSTTGFREETIGRMKNCQWFCVFLISHGSNC